MNLRNLGFPKTWLDKYQKGTASEYPRKSNMVNGTKNW